MPEINFIFCLALIIVAILYSSVGHGGASGYLALLALAGCSTTVMKSTALTLNIFVSLIAFVQYYRTGNFKWSLLTPLVIASIPMAFIGGSISLVSSIYKPVLGILLLIAASRFLYSPQNILVKSSKINIAILLLTGGLIGFVSGIFGIGGGIILSPIILLMGWADVKQTAGISALFIFLNSLAGIVGNLKHGISFDYNMILMISLAVSGGLIGSYIGSKMLPSLILKRVLVIVIVIASIKLLVP